MGNGHSASIGFCFPSNEVEFACRTYGMRALLSTTRCEWDTSTVVAEVTGAALSISPLSAIGSAWRHWAKSPILLPIPPHLSFHGVVKVCRGGDGSRCGCTHRTAQAVLDRIICGGTADPYSPGRGNRRVLLSLLEDERSSLSKLQLCSKRALQL